MNPNRIGNFTSSEIGALMTFGKDGKSFGKPALTYIEEKNMERKLGRSLNSEISARPTTWGSLVELQAFNNLGIEYKICSDQTIDHPTIAFWKGSPDCIKGDTVVDIKCPHSLKSFCQLAECKTIEEVMGNHKYGEDYYFQLISNAILTNSNFAELIVYCPYKHELEAIRELASNFDGNQNKIAWIGFAEDNDLPYLIEGGHYKNLNIIRFEVTESDKEALTERVLEAGKLLINPKDKEPEYSPEEQVISYQEKIKMINELKKKLAI